MLVKLFTDTMTLVDGDGAEAKYHHMISHVAPRIPKFYSQNPELWFVQTENAFAACSPQITTEETKYAHIVKELPESVAQEVSDLLLDPPTVTPYTKLKKELILRMGESRERRLAELLSSCPLGDAKPSAKLRSIRTKARQAGCGESEAIIRKIWIDSLPDSTRPILAALGTDAELEKLAEAADRIRDIPSANSMGKVCPVIEKPKIESDRLAQLEKAVTEIKEQLRSLVTATGNNRARSPSRGREGARPSDVCWKHHTFGDRAFQCAAPGWCRFADRVATYQRGPSTNRSFSPTPQPRNNRDS